MAVCPACRVDAKFENALTTAPPLDDMAFADVRAKLATELSSVSSHRQPLKSILFPANWWMFAAGSAAVVAALILLT